MKFKNILFVVKDIEKSRAFYEKVLGLHVTADFGENITLTGGLSLQSQQSWSAFIGEEKPVRMQGNDAEIYFETEDIEQFAAGLSGVEYVHALTEFRWGQRGIRFYDPDGHIIEVAETLKAVCLRFLNNGLTAPEIARHMQIPEHLVKKYTEGSSCR